MEVFLKGVPICSRGLFKRGFLSVLEAFLKGVPICVRGLFKGIPIRFRCLFKGVPIRFKRAFLEENDRESLVSSKAVLRESYVSQPLLSFLRHVGKWAP